MAAQCDNMVQASDARGTVQCELDAGHADFFHRHGDAASLPRLYWTSQHDVATSAELAAKFAALALILAPSERLAREGVGNAPSYSGGDAVGRLVREIAGVLRAEARAASAERGAPVPSEGTASDALPWRVSNDPEQAPSMDTLRTALAEAASRGWVPDEAAAEPATEVPEGGRAVRGGSLRLVRRQRPGGPDDWTVREGGTRDVLGVFASRQEARTAMRAIAIYRAENAPDRATSNVARPARAASARRPKR